MCVNKKKFYMFIVDVVIKSAIISSDIDASKILPLSVQRMILQYGMKGIPKKQL